MKRSEAEAGIRHLCSVWRQELGPAGHNWEHPSFTDFVRWVRDNHHGPYLDFRSTAGPLYDAELWFDQEFKQTWRN